jgi:pimeloyl-ACP methyl ester carboxylesterase
MEKKLIGLLICFLTFNLAAFSQVDTSFVYNRNKPYGGLDIRIAKSPTNYYYLQEGQTFSFRESAPGVRTNTYRDMTSWDSSPYQQGHLREKSETGDQFVMNYRLLMPEGYNAAYKPGYPIVLILHGYGERGNCDQDLCYHATRGYSPATNDPPAPTNVDFELLNNDHNLLHGARNHLAAMLDAKGKLPDDPTLDSRAFPGFVLFPQNLNGWDQMPVQDAIRILRLMIKKYNIDEDRVYVEGISNGGHGMYEAIKRAPWLFAAAMGMSAVDDGYINQQGLAHTISHIPLWLFQGGFDITPYPAKTKRYVQQFRSAGADVRYTLYPELGHGTWNQAFKEPDFFSWMLGANRADIHSYVGTEFICSDEGTRLELPEGFFAYQWQYNGQVIAGANEALYYAKNPGTYRARFSRVPNPTEGQWNQWSKPLTLTVTPPPEANITQVGTVLLKDLNGFANARLESSEVHAQYYWYKDGKLIDFPTREDDTLKVVDLAPTYGNGAYTLVVSAFGCTSTPSAPKHVFFNNSAPVNIATPTDFAGFSTSPAENTLSWKDVSNNEGGFEIWRRMKNGNSYSPWQMAGLTGANVTTFDDIGLEPTAIYQYKTRAVSSTGRSEYTPAGAGEGVVVETIVDPEPPTAPIELGAKVQGVQKILLYWKPSTDNTRIREYYVYHNGDSVGTASSDTTFLLTDIPLNKRFNITVKGMDVSRNLSPASNRVSVSTYFAGLFYQHTTGSWTGINSVNWGWHEFSGIVPDFTLSRKTQDDYYNFSFDGFLLIDKGGSYQFRTGSSDGSRLTLDGKVLVNNDGIHDFATVTSAATSLAKGPHRIFVQYFESTELDSLVVEYKGPDTGNQWMIIPREALKSDPSVITAIASHPDNGPEDSFIVNIYPNPATQDDIHVQVETVIPSPVRVRLIDPMGRNLFEEIFQPGEIAQGIRIAPPGVMNTGMYVVVVRQERLTVRKKVLVKRP